MKKLLYLLLLIPFIYLASCSSAKDELTPETGTIEETIVGKTWKLLGIDAGWFHLNDNNTYLTKDYLCDTLEEFGTWELDGSVLIFKYTDGPIEYIERNTIIEYNDSIVKVNADTSSTLDINIIFEIVPEGWGIFGCMDSAYANYNPEAVCPDTCINTAVYGCTDSTACNFDPFSNINDGSCNTIYGCMDPLSFNYNSIATCDDGSCCFIAGCTDSTAFNYDPLACYDDSTCEYVICNECYIVQQASDGSESSWQMLNSFGGTEFCGEELEDAESSSYIYIVTDILVSGNDTLFAGEYGPGSANSQHEIHCEDHGAHDDH